ncbi:hypothetical protein BGZ68_005618 [Mortierella alpina]|nr:hypothetical protein BGZ68_005618 [Mortierella alpina]
MPVDDFADNIVLSVDDIDALFEDDEDDSSSASASRARLKALQALLKVLVESPHIDGEINMAWVRRSGFGRMTSRTRNQQRYCPRVILDMDEVSKLCRRDGLKFVQRITIVDELSVYIMGEVITKDGDTQRHPMTSKFDQRKKNRAGTGNYWTEKFQRSGLTKQQVFSKAESCADNVKEQEAVAKHHKALVARLVQEQSAASETEKNAETSTISGPVRDSIPTWEHPAVEDRADRIDISQLLQNCRGKNRQLVFSGNDYGLVTMSETVGFTLPQIQYHLYRYDRLQDRSVPEIPRLPPIPALVQTPSQSQSRNQEPRRSLRRS